MDIFTVAMIIIGLAIIVILVRSVMRESRHGYDRIIAWGSRRIGPLSKQMDEVEIHNYVTKIQGTASKPLHEKTVAGLKKHLKKTHGTS